MHQERILAIHDISCVGRCSLTVAIPIISSVGIECSGLPTAVLSTHTGGFTGYTYRDLTEDMVPIDEHWQTLGIRFDAFYTGFLGSFEQIDIVKKLFRDLSHEGTRIYVDPVMADKGKLYPVFGPDFPAGMRQLCEMADVIMPNLTELSFMLGIEYKEGPYTREYIDSVLDLVGPLHERGFEVSLVAPDRLGVVTPPALSELVDETCALVSVMYANNETGVIQPVEELARVAHSVGAVFHTDAVQGLCHVPLDLSGVDAVSVAAHKIGGPVGVGALAVRGRVPLRPQTFGGGQERGLRAGTQDVRGALSFAAVARSCVARVDDVSALVGRRARALYERLCADGTGIVPTVALDAAVRRLPGIVSVMVPALDSETLILALDQAGFEVSAASACSSGSLDASHVLLAMGIPRDEALGSLRISFDERVPEDELDRFATTLTAIVAERARGRRR